MSSNSKLVEIRQVVGRYINQQHQWRLDQYRLEFDPDRKTDGCIVVNVIYLEDRKRVVPGGGKSIQLYFSEESKSVVRELAMQ